MFGLDTTLFLLLFFCILCACAFEFVNGFHDTANAVATVIYTNSLKPNVAVIWSGFCNFLGVFAGGIGVAMGIVNLLPVELLIDQNVYHSIAMVLALLFSAIIWNLGTWYFGLPSSSSHTLIGSILGVGLAFTFMPENTSGESAVNWSKAGEIGLSLLFSPLLGFGAAAILMFVLRRIVKGNEQAEAIFKEPKKNAPPPTWIRALLILTCTGVSFGHGSNDGQKGVGLVMLILIGIVPSYFAIDSNIDPQQLQPSLVQIGQTVSKIDTFNLSGPDRKHLADVKKEIVHINTLLNDSTAQEKIPTANRLEVRRDILLIGNNVKKIIDGGAANLSKNDTDALNSEIKNLKKFTDYAPTWVLIMIALSLGLGTMIGWKRIVVTVGEKIGKQHLTYAQGASAELVAAITIALSTFYKLPVSTTHILSSGIAGSMVASKGVKNLQPKTVRNIAMAWVLTLPVSIMLAATLFLFFRWIL
ncbi:MAG: inorganic phosphate transporter [Spirosomataceae bacterium]